MAPPQLALAHEDLFEGFSELWVEDSIDNRIEEGVHVADPGGQPEESGARLEAFDVRLLADGVHDVAGKEWDPAHQESTCGGGEYHYKGT